MHFARADGAMPLLASFKHSIFLEGYGELAQATFIFHQFNNRYTGTQNAPVNATSFAVFRLPTKVEILQVTDKIRAFLDTISLQAEYKATLLDSEYMGQLNDVVRRFIHGASATFTDLMKPPT